MIAHSRILVVDDEVMLGAALRRLLQRAGYEVTTVRSAEEAIAWLESEPVSLVISDMLMPGLSGLELLTLVRKRWPQTLRLLVSGHYIEAEKPTAQPVFHAWLPKPWDNQDLLKLLAGLTPALPLDFGAPAPT